VAGLPFHSAAFSTLPPHFSRETLDSITPDEWIDILPLYESYPPGFARALPFLLASLVYHQDWLRSTLSPDHKLFNAPIFTNDVVLRRLKDQVLLGQLECPVSKLKSTGIPPHLAIASGVNKMEETMRISNEALLTEIPLRVRDTMFDNFEFKGAVPITRSEMSTHFEKMMETMRLTIQNQMPRTEEKKIAIKENNGFYTWGGRLHPIPQNFKMPRVDCKTLWRLWHYGRDLDNIPAFSIFHKFDFSDPKEASLYFKGQKVMNKIRNLAIELNIWLTDKLPKEYPKKDLDLIFEKAFAELIKRAYPRNKSQRVAELSYATISNQILKLEKLSSVSVMGAAITSVTVANMVDV